MPKAAQKRFLDRTGPIARFADLVLVTCPTCKGTARVTTKFRSSIPFVPESARVQCTQCSFTRTIKGSKWGEPLNLRDSKWYGPVQQTTKDRCSNCGFKWLATERKKTESNERQKKTGEAECPACHKRNSVQLRPSIERFSGRAIDPTFGLPLWLQTPCSGHTLWAYNARHLSMLRTYVEATLRERAFWPRKWTTFTRMPQWFKSAKNRDEVLRCIGRLEKKLISK